MLPSIAIFEVTWPFMVSSMPKAENWSHKPSNGQPIPPQKHKYHQVIKHLYTLPQNKDGT
ncbi:hypothetical protein BG000_005675 [Podila horticola]|nr:hypothetical protein BG000_005675 [Podila horticola]